MNKKLLIFMVLGLFLFSLATVSASVDYSQPNETYTIDTWVPNWIGGNGQSTVKLIENTDVCLIDCSFTLEFDNEKPVNLLQDISFVDERGADVSHNIKNIKFTIGQYKDIEKTRPIYTEVCSDQFVLNNQTGLNETQNVCGEQQTGNETYTENELVWNDYNGEKVAGLSYLKADAKKKVNKKADWIVKFRGEKLVNWAWWDASWQFKRELSALTGDFSYLETITYDADMNADFSDLRFLDFATESIELNYTIESYISSTSAIVRIYNQGTSSVMMYYGNSGATTTSSASDTYFNPVSYYYLDEASGTTATDSVGTNDGTNNGATVNVAGKINTAYSFDGINDYINTNLALSESSGTISFWYKGNANTGDRFISSFGATLQNGQINIGMSGNVPIFEVYNTGSKSLTGTTTINDNAWHNLIMTYTSGGNIEGFVDGVSEGTLSVGTFTPSVTQSLWIGEYPRSSGFWLTGTIDEVGIWSRALSSTEITQLYNQTAPSFITGAEEANNNLAITSNSPIDNYNSTSSSIDFNCSATDETGVLSLNLTINSTVYKTVTGDGTTNLTLTSTEVLSDDYYNWYCTANDDTKTVNTTTRTLTVDSTVPTITVTSPVSEDFITNGDTLNLNWTTSDVHPDTCWYNYNSINTTLTCSANTTTFNYVANQNTLTFYANDTFGNENNNVTNLIYKIIENNRTISSSTYETSLETFAIDVIANSTLDSVTLDYNGTDYTTTQSGNSYSKTFDIPSSNLGNNTVKWKFNYGTEVINSTPSYQDVGLTLFTLCNATYTDDYLNFSFKDEATLGFINATVPTSTFEYYLGSGTQTKTTTYSSTSLAYTYDFCATSGLPLTVDSYFQYKQGIDYPQRIYDPDILTYTSSLTNKTLYLLNSIDGIYVTFQIITAAQQQISGVDVTATRTISEEDVVVGHSTTDSAGSVTFWLNPDFQHTFVFSKTGYETYTTTFAPTQSSYTLTLTGSSTISSDCSREVINKLTPSNTYIDQNTNYDFIYKIGSTFSTLDSFTASLYYGDNTLINTKSSTSGTGGALTFSSINTTNQSSMYMTYSYDINSSTCYSNAKTWIIQSTEGRKFSITRLLSDIGLYTSANVLGIKGESGTDNFSQVLIAFFTLISIAGFVSSRYGIGSEMFIMVMTLGFIVMFSITGIIPQIQIGQNTLSIYFLPIVTLLMLLAYALKEDLFR